MTKARFWQLLLVTAAKKSNGAAFISSRPPSCLGTSPPPGQIPSRISSSRVPVHSDSPVRSVPRARAVVRVRRHRVIQRSIKASLAFGSTGAFGQPQQQQTPQANPMFGNLSTPATNPGTTSAFGTRLHAPFQPDSIQLTTRAGGFGGAANTSTGAFGAKPTTGFGAFGGGTGTSTFGSGTSAFGQPASTTTTGTGLFGQPSTTTTGTSAFGGGGGLFGNKTSTFGTGPSSRSLKSTIISLTIIL